LQVTGKMEVPLGKIKLQEREGWAKVPPKGGRNGVDGESQLEQEREGASQIHGCASRRKLWPLNLPRAHRDISNNNKREKRASLQERKTRKTEKVLKTLAKTII